MNLITSPTVCLLGWGWLSSSRDHRGLACPDFSKGTTHGGRWTAQSSCTHEKRDRVGPCGPRGLSRGCIPKVCAEPGPRN